MYVPLRLLNAACLAKHGERAPGKNQTKATRVSWWPAACSREEGYVFYVFTKKGRQPRSLPPPFVPASSPWRAPKSSLYCTRHAVLPDNEFEAAKGLHVEDIDCSLVVRPTRTALDLTFFGEVGT